MNDKKRILLVAYVATVAFFFGYFAILLDKTHANKIQELSKENATLAFNMKKIELHEFKARLEKADADFVYNIENSIIIDVSALFLASVLPLIILLPRKRKEAEDVKSSKHCN